MHLTATRVHLAAVPDGQCRAGRHEGPDPRPRLRSTTSPGVGDHRVLRQHAARKSTPPDQAHPLPCAASAASIRGREMSLHRRPAPRPRRPGPHPVGRRRTVLVLQRQYLLGQIDDGSSPGERSPWSGAHAGAGRDLPDLLSEVYVGRFTRAGALVAVVAPSGDPASSRTSPPRSCSRHTVERPTVSGRSAPGPVVTDLANGTRGRRPRSRRPAPKRRSSGGPDPRAREAWRYRSSSVWSSGGWCGWGCGPSPR